MVVCMKGGFWGVWGLKFRVGDSEIDPRYCNPYHGDFQNGSRFFVKP